MDNIDINQGTDTNAKNNSETPCSNNYSDSDSAIDSSNLPTNSNCDSKEFECDIETLSIKDDDNLEELSTEDSESIISVDITPEKDGGVLKKVLKEGEGEEYPGYGDRVSVHYTGWRLGKEVVEFDSSRKGEKFEFNLGRGQVIKGWDLGLSSMKKGERAVFICHPRYAYGDMGYPPTIPPATPLVFDIELFDWKMEDLSPKKDETILRKVLEKGEGNTCPNEGSQVKVRFVHLVEDMVLEETEKDFILGEGCLHGVLEGLELALYKFHLGETSRIHLRKKYMEGMEHGYEVQYKVTLLHFQKAKDVWEMNSDEKFEKAKVSKEKGVDFYKRGHPRLAVKQFRWVVSCLEKEPGVSPESQGERQSLLLSAYLNLALCQIKLENHLDAMKACDKALAIDPNNEKALYRRGQARVEMNDCEEALQDFETLCRLNPENRAAQKYVGVCQRKMKEHRLKDKSTYNNMFEIFVKQDEERLKNMKTETGVWEGGANDESTGTKVSNDGLNESNSALLNANVIEISNTAY